MPCDVQKIPYDFASSDGVSTIRGFIWQPQGVKDPKGVVLLIHGMAEYIDRYDPFARFLAEDGFVVCGHDHIGHGHSQPDADKRGCLPLDGKMVMMDDCLTSLVAVGDRYPYAPLFVFGHSMGSFIARCLVHRCGKLLAGAVFCGTGYLPPATAKAGNLLAQAIAKVKGLEARSNLLHSLADGAYSKAIPHPRTDFDWLNTDQAQVDAYMADPLCGFMFSAGGYAALTDATYEACQKDWGVTVPPYLPLLYVAGAYDPVGDNGKGVQKSANMAKDAGIVDVQTIIYPDMRHEILNEPAGQRVYDDVRDWLNDLVK